MTPNERPALEQMLREMVGDLDYEVSSGVYAGDALAWRVTRRAALAAAIAQAEEIEDARLSEEAMAQKYDTLREQVSKGHDCVCSYDRPNDVCAIHSPQLIRLRDALHAAIRKIEALRDGLLADYALATKYEHNAALVPDIKARLETVDEMLAILRDVQEGGQMTVECPECQGEGRILYGIQYVSRDMATDAGEPGMEGMPMEDWGPCQRCGGGGFVELEPE